MVDGGICIIVPVLWRPQNVAPTIATVKDTTPEPYRLLFVATETDTEEIAELERCGADYVTINEPGTYARKINFGIVSSTEPLLFAAADDLRFHARWLEYAKEALVGRVQVVGTNDLGNRRTILGEHSTHTLFTRAYVEDPGGVFDGPPNQFYCEKYPHEFCDDEAIGTAKIRGVYAHAYQSHVEHLHYLWDKGEDDDTYRLGRAKTARARMLYRQRRQQWMAL